VLCGLREEAPKAPIVKRRIVVSSCERPKAATAEGGVIPGHPI